MSAGGGVSSSSTATKDIPKWALPFFKSTVAQEGQSALDQFNASGGASNGPLGAAGANTVMQEVSGANLDPSNNPTQQAVDANTQAQAKQQFAGDLNAIEGNANAAGMLYNSGVPAAEADAGQKLATGVAGVTTAADQNWVQQQAGIQAGATGQAGTYNQTQLNDYLQMLNALRGISSSSQTGGYSANITI